MIEDPARLAYNLDVAIDLLKEALVELRGAQGDAYDRDFDSLIRAIREFLHEHEA